MAVAPVVLPLTGVISAAVGVCPGTLAVELAVLERAGVRVTIGVGVGAFAVMLSVLPLTGVRFAIGACVGALAVLLSVLLLAGVRVGIIPRGEWAITIAFAVFFAAVWHTVTAC